MNEAVAGPGQFRRFGAVGPLYEVLATPGASEALARIRLIETGEEVDYPLSQLVDDPVVH